MNSVRQPQRRTLFAVTGAFLIAAVALAFVLHWDLTIFLAVVGGGAAVLAVIVGILTLSVPPLETPPESVEKARMALAQQVKRFWAGEVEVRHLSDPDPLVVRWQLTEEMMDKPENIQRAGELRFSGRTDDVAEFVRAFRRLERQRLVVLGEPGMGKTTLAVLMLCEMLKDDVPDPRYPVPVFLSMADWNVDVESFDRWLERRLATNYPSLRAVAYGPTAPRDLALSDRILPILDGLDELAERMRARALNALSAAARRPLIVTSRSQEYTQAVDSAEGRRLRGAAVVEAQPLSSEDIEEYLRRCLDKVDGSWPTLLSRLSEGPIADALTTPLRLWLLRTIFIDRKRDPADICEARSADAVRDMLLDNLIPSLIATNRARTIRLMAHAGGLQLRTRRNWNEADTRRWLGYLADLLNRSGEVNVKWWDLRRGCTVDLARIRPFVGAVAGAAFGYAVNPALAGWFACIGALIFVLNEDVSIEPRYANLTLKGRSSRISAKLWVAFRFTIPLGAVMGGAFFFILDWRVALVVGLSYAVVGGILFTLSDSIATPSVADDRASTPRSTLRADRVMTTVHILAVGITNMVALGFAFGLEFGLLIATTFALVGSLGTFVRLPVGRGRSVRWPFGFSAVGSASAAYAESVVLLAIRRRLPGRLMTFLDDCYRLGLLRQDGPFYQFRHDELKQRLAAAYRSVNDERRVS